MKPRPNEYNTRRVLGGNPAIKGVGFNEGLGLNQGLGLKSGFSA